MIGYIIHPIGFISVTVELTILKYVFNNIDGIVVYACFRPQLVTQ